MLSARIRLCLLSTGALSLLSAPPVRGAEPARRDDVVTLDRVQVSATGTARAGLASPAAVTVVRPGDRPGTLGTGVSELLPAVPGVLARSRQNYAQDEQISIRGFGTRASFGIRGVRLYVDGLPATMPDGQGQVSHFPLVQAERIEVLRGPFSALYGNASGGVVQLFTAPGTAPGAFDARLALGSFGSQRYDFAASDAHGDVDYVAALGHLRTDGDREHSAARRSTLHARAGWQRGGTHVTVLANALHAPDAQDPLGLDRAQFADDPRQATAGALLFDTRKSVDQFQLGGVLEQSLTAATQLRASLYGGRREVTQFLSVPVATQANPVSGGGVVELASPFAGADLRVVHTSGGDRPLELSAGLAFDRQRQHRRGFENFVGDQLGVRGALRLQQDDRVESFDQYLQATWTPAPEWTLMAGVRHSQVRFASQDRYVTATNPDDSGATRFEATSPVAGVGWRLTERTLLFAAWGRGFETPTFNELAYRPDAGSGLNLALRDARSRHVEAGLRFASTRARAELVAFHAGTDDELTVNTSSGGRTTFQNVPRARRHGIEASATLPMSAHWEADVAMTWMEAVFDADFLTCAGTPCPVANVPVAAGTRIPGVPRSNGLLALRWDGGGGWHGRAEVQHVGEVSVNNLDDERAAGYTIANLGGGYRWRDGTDQAEAFLTIGNLFDRTYAGSVIVNEGNRRYYEPAPGRNVTFTLAWHWGAAH